MQQAGSDRSVVHEPWLNLLSLLGLLRRHFLCRDVVSLKHPLRFFSRLGNVSGLHPSLPIWGPKLQPMRRGLLQVLILPGFDERPKRSHVRPSGCYSQAWCAEVGSWMARPYSLWHCRSQPLAHASLGSRTLLDCKLSCKPFLLGREIWHGCSGKPHAGGVDVTIPDMDALRNGTQAGCMLSWL